MKLNEKFSIINDDVGVIAVREKASVEIDENHKKLEDLLEKDLVDVT